MGFVHVEFRHRGHGTQFASLGAVEASWPGASLVLDLRKTWRLGEAPDSVAVRNVPGAGLEALAAWAAGVPPADAAWRRLGAAFVNAVDVAGCYDSLAPVIPGSGSGWYYVEFLHVHPDASSEDVVAYFGERRGRLPAHPLHVLLNRIGALGPDPSCLAIWGIPEPSSIEVLTRDLDRVLHPVALAGCGVYAWAGSELP